MEVVMKKLLAFGILVILFFPACAKKSADTSQAPPATPLEQGLLSLNAQPPTLTASGRGAFTRFSNSSRKRLIML